MQISVVIATFNRKRLLAECLRTLVDQDFPKEDFEIVIVIDGSTDGTAGMLKSQPTRPKLTIIEQNNSGQAAARNAGVALSGGDIILLLDDDMQCERNLLSAHWDAHKANASSVVCGDIRPILSSSPTAAEISLHEDLSRYYAILRERGHPVWPDNAWVGPNCSMPREVFEDNGGFDDASFPRRWEDVELGIRLWKLGISFRYAPGAVVSHRFMKSERQSSVDAEEDGASIVRLSRKHPQTRAGSAIYAALGAPLWRRLTTRILSSTRVLHTLGLGYLGKALDRVGWSSNIRRFRNRLSGFQHLLILLAGARHEAGSWRQLKRLYSVRLPVLLYHHIGSPNALMKEHALSVSQATFRHHLRWLRIRGFQPITSAQWNAWCKEGVPLPDKPVLLTFDDGYSDLVTNAFPELVKFRFPALVFVITKLAGTNKDWEGSPLLNFAQIRRWAAHGIEFGGHTRTHSDLASASCEQADGEVRGCRSDLDSESVETTSFAYPYGSFTDLARRSVEGVFTQAFTCVEGLNDLRTDPLLLKRTMVHPGDTILDLEFRLQLGRSPLDPWRSRLRIRSRLARLFRKLVFRHG